MGVIVSVLVAARSSLSVRTWVSSSAVLVTVLSLPALSAAAQIQGQPTSEAQQPATATTESVLILAPAQSTTSSASQDAGAALPKSGALTLRICRRLRRSKTPRARQFPLIPTPSRSPSIRLPLFRILSLGCREPGEPVPPKYDVSQIGHRNVGSGLDFYSIDREIALGHQLSNEVEQSARLVSDPIINEYINRIGQNLVRNSDARVPFTIKILDTDEVNAFALPGGFFYVNSGLILAADDEAELAGVMAHEIAHVAARHATKNMTRAQIWNMASVPLIFIGGPMAYAISEVASIAVPMTYLKFSRDAEREADLLGLEYDYAAGYDPHAFVEFFEKLNVDGKKKHSALAKAFATHPMNADRIKAAQDEIRKYLPDRPEYVVDTSEFENVKTRLISLENGRRLGGAKGGDGNRPVLLKRSSTSSSDSSDSGGSSSQNSSSPADQKDDGRPTLKRTTTPDSN